MVQTKTSDIPAFLAIPYVNGCQEGKLTHGAGDCNGKAKGITRLRGFLAIYDQYVFLPGGNLVRAVPSNAPEVTRDGNGSYGVMVKGVALESGTEAAVSSSTTRRP